MRPRVYYGKRLSAYGFGRDHPFGPDRLDAFWSECERRGLSTQVEVGTPHMCAESELLRFHTAEYVERVRIHSHVGSGTLDDGDTPAYRGVYEASAIVVGSVLDAMRGIILGECGPAFVPIAGLHHARRESASGFCVFNDLGVAIESMRLEFGIQRIAYIDIDAHHGDGVFYAYEDDPDLIFADIHEDGRFLYPGTGRAEETGKGLAQGTKLNIPLAPGADDKVFLKAWDEVEEFVRAARPEFILMQAGADCLRGDPITHLEFTSAAHRHATQRLRAVADEFCKGRLLATGGGGYNRDNLAAAWCEVVGALVE
jgi:acetoin utilization protein AcuC